MLVGLLVLLRFQSINLNPGVAIVVVEFFLAEPCDLERYKQLVQFEVTELLETGLEEPYQPSGQINV